MSDQMRMITVIAVTTSYMKLNRDLSRLMLAKKYHKLKTKITIEIPHMERKTRDLSDRCLPLQNMMKLINQVDCRLKELLIQVLIEPISKSTRGEMR